MSKPSYITYLTSLDEIEFYKRAGVKELILSHHELSRFGRLSTEDIVEILDSENIDYFDLVLEWDILMTGESFTRATSLLKQLPLEQFKAIRVQDSGAIQYITSHTDLQMQLVLETGNHNYKSIETWVNNIGKKRIDRLVLSVELPENVLNSFVAKIDLPVEVLLLGRILLFYTPRSLVRPLVDEDFDHMEIAASSEESPHKGFPVLENNHGTFMFNTKDHSLVDEVGTLSEIGISHLRLDLRHLDVKTRAEVMDLISVREVEEYEELAIKLRQIYPAKLIKGFFRVNKTDVLFQKLKNSRTYRQEDSYLGEIIEAHKNKHLALRVDSKQHQISVGDRLFIKSTDGKEKTLTLKQLLNLSLEPVNSHSGQGVVLLPYLSGITNKSSVFITKN